MSVLEVFLTIYSLFATAAFILLCVIARFIFRNMQSAIVFWKKMYQGEHQACNEMTMLAVRYREAYKADVVDAKKGEKV